MNEGSSAKKITGNLTCPKCNHKQSMEIPTSSCLAFYKCEKCSNIISANKSCCVFCDYGDKKCPSADKHPKQSSVTN